MLALALKIVNNSKSYRDACYRDPKSRSSKANGRYSFALLRHDCMSAASRVLYRCNMMSQGVFLLATSGYRGEVQIVKQSQGSHQSLDQALATLLVPSQLIFDMNYLFMCARQSATLPAL